MNTGIALLASAVAALAIAACGSTPQTQEVHGQIMGGTQSSATVASAYGIRHICAGAVPGTQVTVQGPSGRLLATTTLRGKLPSGMIQAGVLHFSTTIQAGSGPYTIKVAGVNGVVVQATELKHLNLTCG
jgi:hypothetical protein